MFDEETVKPKKPQNGNGHAKPRRFTLQRLDTIKPSTAGAYLVKGLIPRGGLVVIWGPPKCGKSFMHVARGVFYRGRRVKKGAVVYLALEGGGGFTRRIEAYRMKHDIEIDVPSI